MHRKFARICFIILAVMIVNNLVVNASTNKKVYVFVVKSNPIDKSINLDISKSITITFNSKLLEGFKYSKISLTKPNKNVVPISLNMSANILTITPKFKMEYTTKYTLTIPINSIKDTKGNSLSKDYILQFTTNKKTVPTPTPTPAPTPAPAPAPAPELQDVTPESSFLWDGNVITKYNGTDKNVIIPYRCTAISDRAFFNSTIETIIIPFGVKIIGETVFMNCKMLKTVELSEGLIAIGKTAFMNCENLENINIPTSVSSIGLDAFMNCDKINLPEFKPTLSDETSSDGLMIYVYKGIKYVEANDIIPKYYPKCFIILYLDDNRADIFNTSFVTMSGSNKTTPILQTNKVLLLFDKGFSYSLFEVDYYESTILPILTK